MELAEPVSRQFCLLPLPCLYPIPFLMFFSAGLLALFTAIPIVLAAKRGEACIGRISSMSDVQTAVRCTTVSINAFTVPAGHTFDLSLADGTTVNLRASLSVSHLLPDLTAPG